MTLPSSSCQLIPFSYLCVKTKTFIRFQCRQYPVFSAPYKFFSMKRFHSAFIQQSSLQCNPRSSPETIVSALILAVNSCYSVSYCHSIHAHVIKSVDYSDGFIGDRLVSCYTKLGCADNAQQLFDEMPNKDLVSWNNLITGFARKGLVDKCTTAFFRMKFELDMEPNEVTLIAFISACIDYGAVDVGKYIHGIALKLGLLLEVKVVNSLINMYGKFGSPDVACQLFEAMPVQNFVSWNLMVSVPSQNGFPEVGIGNFNMMRRTGLRPDDGTMVALLQACGNLGVGKLAEAVHGLIVNCGLNANVTVATSLLDLYAKLGRLKDSRKAFGELIDPDRVSWTAMLAGYAVHGHGKEAVELFECMLMKGMEPDHVTFVHLLNACSHSGLVNEGKNYFKIMSQVYGIQPRLDHYSCMVDLLGRSGLLNDAYELITSMSMEPNSGVWGALFGACRVYGNIELGKEVAERLFDLEPSDSRNYIMLSNMYSAAGLWKDASKVRALMKDRGLIRNPKPGCSYIEHENKIYSFVADDQSHPESEKIHKKLEELIQKIRKAGFVSKTEYVLHDVEEEVKEEMISKHSEKLAIAFGILVTHVGMPIIITKNLRICGDCHGTAKFISLVEKRAIIIRDAKRFHHFADGSCSCGDFW
ncbi:pentatricopeptide repeat-containing protein At5g40410, mitochondrial [Humulus lupulus]|uniref:pentatricopeptide repeat-containing protein At5g40410, mitochondrial n=1 Tax=Humulus lupulus TaxID=3486 RepID=UPI002B40306E|nr:pentatricopeptide repeat-containing protein At5g40410, mitochondrial [Humulus lupulus]